MPQSLRLAGLILATLGGAYAQLGNWDKENVRIEERQIRIEKGNIGIISSSL